MTLRQRVLALAVAALALIVLLGIQLTARYAQLGRSLDLVADALVPASTASADLASDVNNMDRRLRIYVSSGERGYEVLYGAAVTSARANTESLGALLGDQPPFPALVADVSDSLDAWVTMVGDPARAAMADGDARAAQALLNSREGQALYSQLNSDAFRLSSVISADQQEALDETASAARRLAWSLGLALLVLLLIPLVSYLSLRRHVLAPISQLRAQLRTAATPGHHDEVIEPSGPPELRELGSDAEALRRSLVHEIDESAAAREALEQEGPVVEAIRQELAASAEPAPGGVTVAGVMRPAEGVLAGDFWDRLAIPDGRAAVLICDVSGHGPRAGIVAMRLKTSITLGLVSGAAPASILPQACDAFADEPGRFATTVVLVTDPASGVLEWTNAGHPAPRLIRADGTLERLETTGPMVSWLAGQWTTARTSLGPEDMVVAFTDGILESRDESGEELGEDDLDGHLLAAAAATRDPDEFIALTLAAIRQRAEHLRDDVTLVAMRLDPPSPTIPTPR